MEAPPGPTAPRSREESGPTNHEVAHHRVYRFESDPEQRSRHRHSRNLARRAYALVFLGLGLLAAGTVVLTAIVWARVSTGNWEDYLNGLVYLVTFFFLGVAFVIAGIVVEVVGLVSLAQRPWRR